MPRLSSPGPSLLGVVAVTCALTALSFLLLELPTPDTTVWQGGTVRVGYALDPPYSGRMPDGTVTGLAPTLAREVLARAGATRIRWVLGENNALIPDLLAGHIDMIASGLFISAEYAARIAFSLPISASGRGLLVQRGNPRNLNDYTSLPWRQNLTVAVQDGSAEHRLLLQLGMPADALLPVPDALVGANAVRQGRADALAVSGPTATTIALTHPAELEAANPFTQPVQEPPNGAGLCAFALRKSDTDLLDAINTQLQALMGTPEYFALVRPFGFDETTLPPFTDSKDD